DSADLYSLAIAEDDATVLGCEAGPLTSGLLQQVLLGDEGVMAQLSQAQPAESLAAKLAALWHVLMPEKSRGELTAGKWSRLIVVPNGPLAFLPFEALVTTLAGGPKYFLDACPPVYYAPSVTVLDSLRIRPPVALAADREPVLTVGDPSYGDAEQGAAAARNVIARGLLTRLPNSGVESRWVSELFDRDGVPSVRLAEADATEANFTDAAPARKLIHLACHGLTDQAHGNLFGALALTPGGNPDEDPRDDGFLTLAEIYDLDLRGCELAILSACETNYGPEQQGEGIWSLSRGFLVAGTRRVVASNWVVDDEATAHLVSYFCGGIAKAEAAGEKYRYGPALLAAKRQIRQQAKWQAPYYWASMVLIGPP
ncbi:MAG: CHAT domain-containing protein, partial [Planctomycetaceae bacterium]|nr:CHAT domain-containing protein [Planctomycetaceae bacterium]